ncbi:MAG: EAL domain-containing protein [Lachnospiraceae bacterium]|nr:EAL domain-containing protein [Ruminococcus sp.]MCM1274267.1 EAL domain-containing protein [Lachnospiraceae bacterium]
MAGFDNMGWKEIFGEAWPKIIEFCPEIGGFLISHETRQVFLDGNARALSGMDEVPDYETMLAFINKLPEHFENGTQLSAQMVSYNDNNLTAGILKRSEDYHEWQRKSILPVCENSRLVLEISQSTAPSLLALIEFETRGEREPTKYQIFDALTAMINHSPKGTLTSVHSANRFWLYIPNFVGTGVEYLEELRSVVESGTEDGFSADRRLTFSAGIGESAAPLAKRMSTAEFALYEANLNGTGGVVGYSVEKYESNKSEFEKMSRFLRLINENLFTYHFQPIVSAYNGEIVAYEMLMRSESSIGMYPMEILDCAERARRLYDIEKATMRNSLDIIGKHQDLLKNRKLFVNSITAHMLADEDWHKLEEEYGELMEKMVIEFTEQTEIDDAQLEAIHERMGRCNIKLAVDDYGTGYSNTSNLIRYNPDYVKIDRALIEGIHTKPKIRKLVSGIIEFIHENGYQALAEGVETYEELQTMILLGADLIQGFYTSKPKPVMLLEISESVVRDIENINLEGSGNISRAYHPAEGETVDLCMLKADNYSSVFVETENVTLKGRTDILLDTLFVIKDGLKTRIVLDNVRVKTDKDAPSIMLGVNSEAEIELVGKNEFDGKGVYVPQSSSVNFTGKGDLRVISNRADCYAIGTDSKENPGNIVISTEGKVYIEANGDLVTAVGGGKNERANVIRFIGGDTTVICSGRKCTAIGISEGGSLVDFENCKCTVSINSPDSVGIGSIGGAVDLQMKNFFLDIKVSGINTACIGTLENGSGRIMMRSGTVNCGANGRTINCIGTHKGNLNCRVSDCSVDMRCEGGLVNGIGDMYGDGEVYIEDTELNVRFLAGEALAYGSRNGLVQTKDCTENIFINE